MKLPKIHLNYDYSGFYSALAKGIMDQAIDAMDTCDMDTWDVLDFYDVPPEYFNGYKQNIILDNISKDKKRGGVLYSFKKSSAYDLASKYFG